MTPEPKINYQENLTQHQQQQKNKLRENCICFSPINKKIIICVLLIRVFLISSPIHLSSLSHPSFSHNQNMLKIVFVVKTKMRNSSQTFYFQFVCFLFFRCLLVSNQDEWYGWMNSLRLSTTHIYLSVNVTLRTHSFH